MTCLQVCPGMYCCGMHYYASALLIIEICTNIYQYSTYSVLVCTSMYWYVLVRTSIEHGILPGSIQYYTQGCGQYCQAPEVCYGPKILKLDILQFASVTDIKFV